MIILHDDFLTVQIDQMGAELISVKDNESQIEYMWQADSTFWGRHAPILFPIVGRLHDDQYQLQDQTYGLTQHGFARDRDFTVVSQTPTKVILEQRADAETKQKYPFDYQLTVTFELKAHELQVAMTVMNPNQQELPFSIGAHPGFNVPLDTAGGSFTDYQVTVAPKRVYDRIPLSGPYSEVNQQVTDDFRQPKGLNHQAFDQDAKILALNGEETTVMLSSTKDDHGVALHVGGAPYVGIWSPYPKEAPFVCIEPWWGIADPVDHDGNFLTKPGLNRLAANQQFTAAYSISYF
ncbi:aldose 1-epimerase family protein [Levilactobacillus bambusae]|uniref:Galactose mutarotase n=1 Tax=Levilactobacillus bambusae TaxID=2024736 RepID=A0A2V1N1C5_9LACO|nr:aldose 1-epimerase family protein [Levilactobacillus bambusae]PWG00823.1 galactose mutarotase [Levilactobacillus bambusae]